MKKASFILILFFSALYINAQNKIGPAPKIKIIKTNAYQYIFDQANLTYEKEIDGKTSYTVSLAYQFKDKVKSDIFELNRSFKIDATYRFFLINILDDAPRRFYIGPSLGFDINNYQEKNINAFDVKEIVYTNFKLGGTFGYQWLIEDKIAIDLFTNPQYVLPVRFNEEKELPTISNLSAENVIGISVGFVF